MNNPEQQKRISAILRKELETRGLRPLLYKALEGTVTVALLLRKDNLLPVARGVSIQSPNDQPNRRDGNNKALGRALKAFRTESTGSPIFPFERTKEGGILMDCLSESQLEPIVRMHHLVEPFKTFGYKRAFMPVLTQEEEELVAKIKPLASK